jgi:formate hydrogenlyase subunit 3/multisubunit Na+/H+ antiporter MnhD subunit
MVLPCLGWYGVTTIAHDLTTGSRDLVVIAALGGALVGLTRAAVQNHLARLLGSITAALLSLAWWHLGVVGSALPAAWYVAAVAVTACGLLLGAHHIETRYGVRDVEKLGGLARSLPRFSVLVGLLFMAAMGLPLFGVSSTFFTMMFAGTAVHPSFMLMLLVWFVASLLLLKIWHRLFYGPPRGDLQYRDLSLAEFLPYLVLIALLLFCGRLGTDLFRPTSPIVTTAEVRS